MQEKLKDFVKKEFIGLDIEIVEAKNKGLEGIHGKIVDETKSTITIKTDRGNKKIIKNQVKILFKKQKIIVDGKIIEKKTEERIKLKVK